MKKITILFIFVLILTFVFTNNVFAQSTNSNTQITNNFSSQLSLGSRGNSVCALQNILIARGYLKIPSATCVYGPLTFRAVQALQRANGLPTPGRVGPATLRILNSSTYNTNTTNNTTTTTNTTTNTNTSTNTSTSTTTTSNSNTTNNSTPASTSTSNTTTTNTTATNSTNPTTPTCPTNHGTLKVEYPNGGERFQSGSSIDAKWSSNSSNTCPYFKTVSIFLEYSNPNLPSFVPTVYTLVLNTPNDGTETVVLPNISQASQVGPYYIMTITDGTAPYTGNPLPTVQDSSDSVFSIY